MESIVRENSQGTSSISLTWFKATDIDERLLTLLNDVQIFVPHAIIFRISPRTHQPLHSDHAEAKLNISYGAVGSRMYWWKTDAPEVHLKTEINSSYFMVNQTDCKFVESTRVGITLLDSEPIHSVMNNTDDHRFTLSVNLRDADGNMIPYIEALQRLKNYT